MARDDDTIFGEVEALVALMIGRVANEDAQRGARGKLVRSGGGEVGIAGAPERPEVMIGGKSAIEGEERGSHVQSLGGEAIDEVSGYGKSISPIGGGHGGLEEKSPSDIVDGAKHAFGFSILLGGVGTSVTPQMFK